MRIRVITVFATVAIAACSADPVDPVEAPAASPEIASEDVAAIDDESSSDAPPPPVDVEEHEGNLSFVSKGDGIFADGVETDETAIAASATPLEASGNLLKVSGFERSGAWSLNAKAAERVTGGAYRGDYSLRVDSKPLLRTFASQTVPAEAGRIYSVFAHLNIREPSARFQAQMFSLEMLDRDGKLTRWCGGFSGNTLIRQKWQRAGIVRCKAPPGTAKARVRVYQTPPTSGSGKVKWDAFELTSEACIPKGKECDRIKGDDDPIECARCCSGQHVVSGAEAGGYDLYSCK